MNSPNGEKGAGILLPAYTPRWLPWLKGIAAATLFAFTLTCVVPPGFAQGLRRDDTLRALAPEEAPDKAGLEEALRTGTESTAQAEVMTRREFMGGVFKEGAAAAVGYSLLGAVAAGEVRAQELPAEVRTALLEFIRARKITGVEPIMPPNIPKERLARAERQYLKETGQRFRGLEFNGLYREYEPGETDTMLTRYGRIWPYGNALVLLALLALGERKEAQELMDALVRLGKAEEALGFEGGYHFSYNTQGERLVDREVQRDSFIHPVAPTGNTLWVVVALYRAMRELGDWRHLEWVNGLRQRVFERIQIRDEKDIRHGFLPGARYTDLAGLTNPRTKRAFPGVDELAYTDDAGYWVYGGNPNRLLEDVAKEHLDDAVLAAWEAYLTNEAAPKGQRGRWDAKQKQPFLESYRLLVNNLPRLWVKDHFVTGIEFDPAAPADRRLRRNDSVATDNGSWAWAALAYNEEMAWQTIQFNRRNFRVSLRIGDMEDLPPATREAIRTGRIDPKAEVVGTAFWEEGFMDRFIRPLVPAKDPRRAAWRWMIHPEATLGVVHFLRLYAQVTRNAERRKEAQAFETELWRGTTHLHELHGGRLPNAFSPRVDSEGRRIPEPPLFTTLANITSAAWMILVERGGLFAERSGIRLRDLPKELREGIRFEPPRGGLEETIPAAESGPKVNFWARRNGVVEPVPKPAAGMEEAPDLGPAITRREALKIGGAAAAGVALLGASAPEAKAQQPAPNRPARFIPPHAGPPDMRPGVVNGRNTVWVDWDSGKTYFPKPERFYEPRSMPHPRDPWDAWRNRIRIQLRRATLMRSLARLVGWRRDPATRQEVRDEWDPASFAPDERGVLRSYILWAPWDVEEGWWPAIFDGMAKAAGVRDLGRDWPVNQRPHSRIYMDPYGFMSPLRSWSVKKFLELRELARRRGVHIVPILGDPSMGEDPDLARRLMRDFMATGVFVPDSDGVVRIALDIEPDDPDALKAKDGDTPDQIAGKKAKEKEFWENVRKVVRGTQRDFHRRFQLPYLAEEDRSSVEITLYVPPDFFDIVRRHDLQMPKGVRFVVMTYSNRIEGTQQEPGVVDHARRALAAIRADRAEPVEANRRLSRLRRDGDLKWGGVAVDIGPHVKRGDTLFWDPERPLQGRVGDRAEEAGRRLHDLLKDEESFQGEMEYVIHSHDILGDLVPFLKSRGPSPEEMAGREISKDFGPIWKSMQKAIGFFSARRPPPPPARYGAGEDLRPAEDKVKEDLMIGLQRVLAGMVATGGLAAHWATVYDTLMMSMRRGYFFPRVDDDWPMLGPDLGILYLLVKFGYSSQFGRKGRIVKVNRTFVDPSFQADTVLLPGGRPLLGPDGQRVQGRLIRHDPDILVDGTSARRAEDGGLAQIPSNGYNIYWTIEVENLDTDEFRGSLRLLPHTGYGEPIDLNSDPVILGRGERGTYTIGVTVDKDDNASPVYVNGARNDTVADPFRRKGRIHRNVPISEGIFFITEQHVPEIAHAVGVGAFDPLALAEAARHGPIRERLLELAVQWIAHHQFSELAVEALSRPLGVRVQLRPDQEPEEMVRSIADWNQGTDPRHRHGVSYLVVDSPELLGLVRDVRDRRRARLSAGATPEEEARLYEDLLDSWATGQPTAAERLRRLLQEAQAQGLKVVFQVDATQTFSPPVPGEPRQGDPRGVREFFAVLKTVTELDEFGLNKTYSTLVTNADRLDPDELSWVAHLYANAQTPLTLLGNSGLPREIGDLRVAQAHDLTGIGGPAQVAAALARARQDELPRAKKKERPLGMALLTPDQLPRAAPVRDPAQLLEHLVGPARAEGVRRQGDKLVWEGIADPQWLAEQILEPRTSLLALNALLVDGLDLKKVIPFMTGHMSTVAERLAPDRTRGFVFRYWDMDVSSHTPHATEATAYPNPFDLRDSLTVVETGLPPGPHALRAEMAPMAGLPRLPSESRPGSLPLVELRGRPERFWVLDPSPKAFFDVPVAGHRLRFGEGPRVRVTVAGKERLMEEHRTIRFGEGGPVLHLGRNRLRTRLVLWVDQERPGGGAPQVIVPPREMDRTGDARLVVARAAVAVAVRMDPLSGRIRMEVDGQEMDLWELPDQTADSRWNGKVQIGAGQILEVTTQLNAPVRLQVTVHPAGTPPPELATELPTDVYDTTAEQVIGYDRRPEQVGELAGDATLAVAATAAASGVVTALTKAARKADVRARTPFASDLTRQPSDWKGRIWKLAWVTGVTLVVLALLAHLPQVATLMGLGLPAALLEWAKAHGITQLWGVGKLVSAMLGPATWSTWQAWGVKSLFFVIFAKWLADGAGAVLPGFLNRVLRPAPDMDRAIRRVPVAGEFLAGLISGVFQLVAGAGMVIRRVADWGNLIWLAVFVGFFFAAPIPFIKLAAAPEGATLFQLVREVIPWLLAQRLSDLWVAAAGGVVALVAGGLYLWDIGWSRGEEGFKDLGRRLVLMGVVAAVLAATFSLWSGGWAAVAGLTVFGALAGFILFRVTLFWSNFFAEMGYHLALGAAIAIPLIVFFGMPVWGTLAVMLAALTLNAVTHELFGMEPIRRGVNLVLAAGVAGALVLGLGFPLVATLVGILLVYVLNEVLLEAFERKDPLQRLFLRWMPGDWGLDPNIEKEPWLKVLVGAAFSVPVALGLKALGEWIASGSMEAALAPSLSPRIAESVSRFLAHPMTLGVLVTGAFVWVLFKATGMTLRKIWWKIRDGRIRVRPSRIGSAGIPRVDDQGNLVLDEHGNEIWDDPLLTRNQINARWQQAALRWAMRQADDHVRAHLKEYRLEDEARRPGFAIDGDPFKHIHLLARAEVDRERQVQRIGEPAGEAKEVLKADILVRGYAALFQLRDVTQVFALDQSAAWQQGPFYWTARELMRYLERNPWKQSALPAIFTKPHGTPAFFRSTYHAFYFGAGAVVLPIVWFSQGTQYLIAMDFRWLRGFQQGMDSIVTITGSVRSDMANDPDEFINDVIGRWLEGHREVLMEMLGGQTLHFDPNDLEPRVYFRYGNEAALREKLRLRRNGQQLIPMDRDTLEGLVGLHYLDEPGPLFVDEQTGQQNLIFGTGPLGRPTHLVLRLWDDNAEEGGPPGLYGLSDEEAFGTARSDSGHWFIRSLGPFGNLLYAPYSFSYDDSEGVKTFVPDRHMNKLWVRFQGLNAQGELSDDLGTPTKAYWLGSAFEILKGAIAFEPDINDKGEIEFVFPYERYAGRFPTPGWASTDGPGPAGETEALAASELAREGVVAQREADREEASDAHWERAPVLYTDGRWYGPDDPKPAGYEPVGPFRGHVPYGSVYGQRLQFWNRLADWWTYRRFAAVNTLGRQIELESQGRSRGILDWIRSLPHWIARFSGVILALLIAANVVAPSAAWLPFALFFTGLPGAAVGILLLTGLVGTSGLWWLPIFLFLTSGLLVEWVLRGANHVVTNYGPIKHGVAEGIEASHDPAVALHLAVLATEGLGSRLTRGSRLAPLPDSVTGDPRYVQWVKGGIDVLRQAAVFKEVVALGRVLSPEEYQGEPNWPRRGWWGWERWHARRVRSGLKRWAADQRSAGRPDVEVADALAAAQRAVLRIIQREHFAVGEEVAAHLHAGTASPDYQAVGLRSVPTSERRYGPGARVEAWMAEQMGGGSVAAGAERARNWAMISQAQSNPVRVSSRLRDEEWYRDGLIEELEELLEENRQNLVAATKGKAKKEYLSERRDLEANLRTARLMREWLELSGAGTDAQGKAAPIGTAYRQFYRSHSHLQVDAAEAVRVSGQEARKRVRSWGAWRYLLSPELRHSGIVREGDDPKRLGGAAALMAAAAAGGGLLAGWILDKVFGLGIIAAVQAGLAAVGLSLPGGLLLLVGAAVGAILFRHLLDQIAHGLDFAHRIFPPGRLQDVARAVFQGLNRLVGFFGSLAIGYGLAIAAHTGILAVAAAVGLAPSAGPVLALAGVGLIAVVAIYAALASLLAWPLDKQVERESLGDGIRAISLIPGLLVQYPLAWLYRAAVLTLNGWFPEILPVAASAGAFFLAWLGVGLGFVPALAAGAAAFLIVNALARALGLYRIRLYLDVPKSLDLYLLRFYGKISSLHSITGLTDRMEYPFVAGTALGPGKFLLRLTLWWRRITAQEATPVPLGTLARLEREPFWTRILSGLNLLPHRALDFGKALAEDTLLGWMLALGNVGEPASPAVSMHKLNHILWRQQKKRDDEGSVKRAYQFYKGMGLAKEIRELGGEPAEALEDFLKGLRAVSDQMEAGGEAAGRLRWFAEGLQANRVEEMAELARFTFAMRGLLRRDQVLTGARHGAGVYSYLFTAFTSRQLYMQLVGLFAPGEIDALYTYLYYEARDQNLRGGLARQLFQMNKDEPANPLRREEPVQGTLADPQVAEQLIKGWAVDPRAALAAATLAREIGQTGPIEGIGEPVDITLLFVRTMGGFLGKNRLDPIETIARQRRVVDLLHREGKHRIIRLNRSVLRKIQWVKAAPVGSSRNGSRPAGAAGRASPPAAGAEEKLTEAEAQALLERFYKGWEGVPGARQEEIRQVAMDFDIPADRLEVMRQLLDRPEKSELKLEIADPPFPRVSPRRAEDIELGRTLMDKTAVLLGAGGAGGRLFEGMVQISFMEEYRAKLEEDETYLARLNEKGWSRLSVREKLDLVDNVNKVLREERRPLLPRRLDGAGANAFKLQRAADWLRSSIQDRKARLVHLFGLDHWAYRILLGRTTAQGIARLGELIDQMRRGTLTKLTFPLGFDRGKRLPSPLEVSLRMLAKMDPEGKTTVILGVSAITKKQILDFMVKAYQGELESAAGRSPEGTYFGFRGTVAVVEDPVVPVINASSKKLAVYRRDNRELEVKAGDPMKGGAGGAGSLVALGNRIKILDGKKILGLKPDSPAEEALVTLSQTGFEWLRTQKKENLYVGDADAVGTTPDLIYNGLGLMQRRFNEVGAYPPAVAFAYPYPAMRAGEWPPRGRLVRVKASLPGQPTREMLINREAKRAELATVKGLWELVYERSAQLRSRKEVPANSGLYLFRLEALEPLVEATLHPTEENKDRAFRWHIARRPADVEGGAVNRFELQKPDVYELLGLSSDPGRPVEIPIAPIRDNYVIPIKDPTEFLKARKRYYEVAREMGFAAGAEEERPVPDDELAVKLRDLLAGERSKGIFPIPPPLEDRLGLPGLSAWVLYNAGRGATYNPPPDPPGASYCCRLDEARLRHRGEGSFRWRDWHVHGAFPVVEGQATFIALGHGIRPMDRAKLKEMADLARLLPGYRVVDNYSRAEPDGRIVHMGRSVPGHDHLNAIPLSTPAEELPAGFPARIRLFEGSDPEKVVDEAIRYVELLDGAIQRDPGRFQGYNTAAVFTQEGNLRIYLLPRRAYSDPAVQPTQPDGSVVPLKQFQGLPEADRQGKYYLGVSTLEIMGGLITPDEWTFQQLQKDPAQAARVVAALLDSLSTSEEALGPLDAAFHSKAAGVEEEALVMAQAEGRVGAFLRELREAAPRGFIPVVVGPELEARHPEVRALRGMKELPVLFAAGLEDDQVVVELITRWDAREAVVAGMEQEAGRYIAILSAAGIEGRAVTPDSVNLLLEILAQAAGLEQSAVAAREGVGELMDDAVVLGGQL